MTIADFKIFIALVSTVLAFAAVTCFVCGLAVGNDFNPNMKCYHPTYHSYAGTLELPFKYMFWLGCELSEPRFNLDK